MHRMKDTTGVLAKLEPTNDLADFVLAGLRDEREELRAELEALDFWPEMFVRRVE